jgi:malate dehydrogenase (quinone)
MLRCLEQLIPSVFVKEGAREKRSEIFPEDNLDTLIGNPDRYREIRNAANQQLGII